MPFKFINEQIEGLVSVIIPSYNRWKYLQNAVKSVIEQSYKNVEIIIINDHSTEEDYYKETNELTDIPNLKIYHLIENQRKKYNFGSAQGMTRNEGMKYAKGEWIAFLDDDDYWYPNKLEIELNVIKKEKALFCSTNMHLGNGMYGNEKNKKLYITEKLNKFLKYDDIKRSNAICNSSVLLHRKIIEKTDGFKLIQYEDYNLWLEILQMTDCLYIPIPLIYYDLSHGDGILYEKW